MSADVDTFDTTLDTPDSVEAVNCVDEDPSPPMEELTEDCNQNGMLDDDDLSNGASMDCDGDGVVDDCQTIQDDCLTQPSNGWYEYHSGSLPVVLSAPHGGNLKPEELDTRPGANAGRDTNTQETTLALADALEDLTGHRPHVILMNLHRDKFEARRL